jgi:hypothetical protein
MKASVYLSIFMLSLGISAMLSLSACGESPDASGDQPVTAGSEFALYALSRGKGVPEPTRDAFEKANTYLEESKQRGEVLSLSKTRIGLEGETRLCVQAKDAAAARDLQQKVRSIAENVELFNVVEEPCSKK